MYALILSCLETRYLGKLGRQAGRLAAAAADRADGRVSEPARRGKSAPEVEVDVGSSVCISAVGGGTVS